MFAMLSSVRLSSVCRLCVCRLSVTFVHPTQPIEIFGNVSAPFNTNVTDRQTTDRRQTDGRRSTYSEHEHEFTFAKNSGRKHPPRLIVPSSKKVRPIVDSNLNSYQTESRRRTFNTGEWRQPAITLENKLAHT